MAFVAENRVADVIEMRHLRFVEEDAILELARVPHYDAIADDDVFADVAAVANFALFPDPGRPFDHRALLDRGPFSDENRAAHERLSDQSSLDARLQTKLQIARDLVQRVPDIRQILEQFPMVAVLEVEKFL